MLENIITFSAPKKYIDLKQNFPRPIKTNVPEWFKKIKHTPSRPTVKGCMPFLDSLTTGYLLEVPVSINIDFNSFEEENQKRIVQLETRVMQNKIKEDKLNFSIDKPHNPMQVEKSPHLKKNLNYGVNKILNPWKIKTPPGYSCLFIPPLNNTDDRFSIIPAIVETDRFDQEINFPFIINGDKYPILNSIIEQGTPYVQIIPFKRESWKFKIEEDQDPQRGLFLHTLKFFNVYKNKIWSKVKWI